jgi:hypothetical protein
MGFDFYVHGLWILGSLTLFMGAMIAGNVEYIEGTTDFSFAVAVLLAFLLILVSGLFWISASVNARPEMR